MYNNKFAIVIKWNNVLYLRPYNLLLKPFETEKKHTHKFVETECSCSAFYVTLCSRFGNLVGLAPVIQPS